MAKGEVGDDSVAFLLRLLVRPRPHAVSAHMSLSVGEMCIDRVVVEKGEGGAAFGFIDAFLDDTNTPSQRFRYAWIRVNDRQKSPRPRI